MMYDPNVFTLNLEQLLSGTPLDTAVGVLQVTIHSARGLKGNKIGGGTPDPFVSLSIENRAEVAHTKYKKNTYVHNLSYITDKCSFAPQSQPNLGRDEIPPHQQPQ